MAGSPAHAQHERFDTVVRVSMDEERAGIVDALAEALSNGSPANRSAAVRYLIDRHAGVALEQLKAAREVEESRPAVEIVRFAKAKICKELIGQVAGVMLLGLPIESACELAGITDRQRQSWWARGKKDRSEGRESLYADFVKAVLQAQANWKLENVQFIRAHRTKVWTSAAWLLERGFPDEFGERKRIDSKVQHSVMPMIDYDRLTLGETRMLLQLLRKASPQNDEPGIGRGARPAAELVPADVIDAVDGDWVELPVEDAEALALERGVEAPGLEDQKPPVLVGAGGGGGSAFGPAGGAGVPLGQAVEVDLDRAVDGPDLDPSTAVDGPAGADPRQAGRDPSAPLSGAGADGREVDLDRGEDSRGAAGLA